MKGIKRIVLITATGVAATLIVFTFISGAGKYATALSQGNGKSLKQRAKEARGKYVGSDDSSRSVIYHSLHDIAQHSSTVIIGTTVSNSCELSSDGQNISTRYEVYVNEVLKGSLLEEENILVSIPGGLKMFADLFKLPADVDRTYAVVNVPEFRKPVNGRTYLFFLNNDPLFTLTGGPQGLFELPPDGDTVRPADLRITDPLANKYKDASVADFLEDVRKSLKNPKE